FCNTRVAYTVRGVHVKLDVLWDYEAAAGAGDTHLAVFRGSCARVEVRQGKEQNYPAGLYGVPKKAAGRPGARTAAERQGGELQTAYPGVGIVDEGERLWVTIPDRYRVGHEAHFGEVTNQFLRYLKDPTSLPAWEKPNMLAKYFVTTWGVKKSQAV